MAKIKDVKGVIKEFIQHVEALENEEDPEGNGFNREYRLIQEEQVRNRRENVFSMDVGKTENNLRKNRYKDILPYDDHRVILNTVDGDEDSSYINASKLMGVKGTGGYIASQGPLAATVNDFWRMIWEFDVEIIFMACRIVELGKIKCKQYWNDADKSDEFGDITVFTESEEEISSDFVKRIFKVTRGEEERYVTHFHYSGWPDHGIPDDPAHIRDLIGIMRRTRHNDHAPLLVHCSAGCGRTGAIIAIDFVWTLLEEGRFDDSFNLYELICNFRKQRMSIVQTADQYALVNKVLKSLCEDWLTKIASHTYVNVELNQGEQYSNVDGTNNVTTQSAEENIYEDSYSLIDRPDAKETSQVPESSSVRQERLLGSGTTGQATDKGPGPEIIDLPAPLEPQKSQAYENVAVSEKKKSAPAPAPPTTSGAQNNEKQVHTTLIQVGFNKNDPKQPQKSGMGGHGEVTYVVQSGGQIRAPSTSSTASGPASPFVPSPSPTSPKTSFSAIYTDIDKKPMPNASKGPAGKPPSAGASETAIYAEVNKKPTNMSKGPMGKPGQTMTQAPVYAEVNKTSPNKPKVAPSSDRFLYDEIDTKSANKPGAVSPSLPLPASGLGDYAVIDVSRSVGSGSSGRSYSTGGGGGSSGGSSHGGSAEAGRSKSTSSPYSKQSNDQNSRQASLRSIGPSRAHTSPLGQIAVPSTHTSSPTVNFIGGNFEGFIVMSLKNYSGNPLPASPPGFKERLPRAKGTVPMPQGWHKS